MTKTDSYPDDAAEAESVADATAADAGPLPLAGIIVADFSRLLPGPWCTQVLGDLGATVIKIEQPGLGDPSRYNPPRFRDESVYFRCVNANKTGLSLDLTHPEAVAIAHRLLARADVMVESFRPDVCRKLKIDYDTARALNPGVIYCAISGFGQSGPLASVPGHDLVVQAAAGVLRPSQDTGAVPMPQFQAADYAAATTACIAILAALRQRERRREGCYIDLSMYDSLMQMGTISFLSALSVMAGGSGTPPMEVWGGNPRYAIYPTKDRRHVAVCLLEAKFWAEFCRAIGRPDLVSGRETPADRLSDHGGRAEIYRQVIADYCLSKARDELAAAMAARGIPIMPVLSPDEALSSEHARARDVAGVVSDPREGRVAELRNPLRAAGLAGQRRSAAPTLGADSEAVLTRLGFSSDEIAGFAGKGII